MDVKVTEDLKVGDLVELSLVDNEPDEIAPAALSDATHIIAQSDMTMNRKDYTQHTYEYSNKVAASTVNKKKVAVYAIVEVEDVAVTDIETEPDEEV